MKAVIYEEPFKLTLAERPLPTLQAATDAIVQISKTTICGTDMAIRAGGVPTVEPGRIIGHEGVGVVTEVGPGVTLFKPGDRVLISCITSCGICENCKRGIFSNCENGGWILGNTIDGCQAEQVRVPYADNGLYHIPENMDDEIALMLSDIVPTGLEVGVMNGGVKFGDTVAIVGAGPVGLAALLTVQFYSPAEIIVVDLDKNRLALAEKMGATVVINNEEGTAVSQILELTDGHGVDVAIEAVGHPATCKLVQSIIGVGGTIANIGVYSQSTELHKDKLWIKNITIRMGVVNTTTIPLLLKTIQGGKLDPSPLITHHFPLTQILEAYDVFANAAETEAVKIVLANEAAAAQNVISETDLVNYIVNEVMKQAASG